MNSQHFSERVLSLEEIYKIQMKMLITIVNRTDCDKTTSFLRSKHHHFLLVCLAEGTAGSELMDLLGLGTSEKSLIICVAPDRRINASLAELTEEMKLQKKGKGIAFTVPLNGLCLNPARGQFDGRKWQENMDNEVDKMNNDITHSIILAVINHGYGVELVAAAKEAGAKGGTIINARSAGTEDIVNIFGASVQAEKEIVAILTTRDNKASILDTINASFGLKSPAHGIALSLPVDAVAGMV